MTEVLAPWVAQDKHLSHAFLQLTTPVIMNAFRVARAALRARPAAMRLPIQPLQRRGYADAAPDKARITPYDSLQHRDRAQSTMAPTAPSN
ncbi:Adenosinetriphosphatase/Nucleoside-triphosphate phosphatase [Xylaria longipes]|nr:Adenosinetriphosphatase/Nucleoside-triphosphate phosphatase [Xylaria longipes]